MSAAPPPVREGTSHGHDGSRSAIQAAAPRFFAMRGKIRVAVWTEALAHAAFALLAYAALTFVADRWLRLETPARATLLIVFVALTVRMLWTRFLQPMRAHLPDDELALAVERNVPSLRQSLISSLQFERRLDAGRASGESVDMMRAVVADAGERIASVPFARALDGKRMGRFTAGLCGVVVLFATWAFASSNSLRLWAARNLLLSAEEWPRATQLAFVGADAGVLRLPQGDALTITVRATGVVPDQVHLVGEFASGENAHEPMSSTGDGEFSVTMEALLENAVLTAEGGDGVSQPLRIEIVERPRIENVATQIVFPAYMQKEPEDVPPTEGEVRIVRGSELRIAARSHKPIASAFLLLGDRKTELLRGDDGHSFSGSIAPDASALLTIDVIDQDQLGAGSPPKLSVRLVEDKAPSVDFKLRGIGPLVTAQVRIPGELKAKDDFGVTKLAAEFRAVLDAPQQKAPTEENAPSEGRDKPAPTPEAPYVAIDAVMRESLQAGAVRHETSLSIDAMQRNKKPDAEDDPSNDIRPGMLLSLRFVATDNFGPGDPHVARSEAFTFRVVTRDKLVDELRRRQVEQRLEVQKMRDDEAAAQLVLRETLSPKADDPRAAQARLQFKQLAARQQSLGRRIALASDLYQRILWEYENNRVWEPSKVREYEALTAVPLADLGKAAFPRTAQEVATFADTGEEELRASALQGYDEILRRLDAILRVMEQVETLAALIEQLRGVIKVEDSAIRDVENKLKAAGESLFQKPGKQK